ncbi:MAG: CocE/NonD family hydrolase, partial [Chloroflexota bacterium]|nr:CocE/NonD family hydrolase [Chloroflexota bacterium]
EVQDSPYLHIQLKYEVKNPLLFDFLLEPHDGPYYWDRSAYPKLDRINVPVLIFNRWSGWPIHLPGAFQAWEGIQSPKKMYIVETEWVTGPKRPWRDHQELILRWYDHWLKGNDTGVMDEPPITILVKGRNELRGEEEWPLARTQWTKYWLHADGLLSPEVPGKAGDLNFANDPYIQPGKFPEGLDFATAPFEQDLEITGPLALYLNATLDQPDATWFINIKDRAPDGSSSVVTKGWLRASHRKLDAERSKPYLPYHPHDENVPVQVGRPATYAIDIRPTSMAFLKGHQLVMEVRGQDTQTEDPVWYHLCNPIETEHTVHCGGAEASYLLLPVIPAR